uniref:IgGFc_binding domain-containing protein n=1 Tax=Rhabditophanes sp. KR3021 TaxID=114890 RepID=A0AC35TXJ7_9BILA
METNASYGKTNEVMLPMKEVFFKVPIQFGATYANSFKEYRIFANCKDEVKLIARFSDPFLSMSELYLVPSIKTAGTYYFIDTITTSALGTGIVTILPVTQQSGLITIAINAYKDGVQVFNKNVQYNTLFGSNQYYIAVIEHDSNMTIEISASSPIMLTFVSPFASSTDHDYPCDTPTLSCQKDYVSYFPVQSPQQCGVILTKADQRMITNNFTTRLYVSSANFECTPLSQMTIYDDDTNFKGMDINFNINQPTNISLITNSQAAFSSYTGVKPSYRFGSILKNPNNRVDAHGHFGHYVPSTEEWLNGKNQFYTLAKDCQIEFYADQKGSNPDLIQIDGVPLSKLAYDKVQMKMFNNQYSQFIVSVKGYGIHTFENQGNYVLYVICGNINSMYDSAGYISGYNTRK